MTFKKETFVFLASLALILIITYINVLMSSNDGFDGEFYNEEALKKEQEKFVEVVNDSDMYYVSAGENIEDLGLSDDEISELNENKKEISEILDGSSIIDITDMSDFSNLGEQSRETLSTISSNGKADISFENFKISKAKNNLDIVDQIESGLSNKEITQTTRSKFEELLVTKNNQIQMENNVELMLQSKGYNDFICIISNNGAKIVINSDIEKSDANIILDIVENETKFTADKIKIVKFSN